VFQIVEAGCAIVSSGGEAAAKLAIVDQAGDCPSQGLTIAGLDQEPGLFVDYELRYSANVGRNNRDT
jgi:hypothetical protein